METKYFRYRSSSIKWLICFFVVIFIQSCTKEKDETLPTLSLSYVSFDSKAQTFDFLVSASEDSGIKSIDVFTGDSLLYTKIFTDRMEVQNILEFHAKINFERKEIKLRAVVLDFANNRTEKTLEFFPTITIQQLSEAIPWQANTSHTISWINNFGGNVQIDLYKDNKFFANISENYKSDAQGSFSWIIPTNIPAGANYRIRISSANVGVVEAYSNSFSILPFIILTNSINTVGYTTGSVVNLRWTDNVNENLIIQLYKGVNLIQTISDGTPNNYYEWVIPHSILPGSDYRIKISTSSNVHQVTNNFSISNPFVKVELPSSSSNWLVGTTNKISWMSLSTVNISKVNIELFNDNGFVSSIAEGVINANNYSWTIPINLNPGYYYVKISDVTNSNRNSQSEKFAIAMPSIYSISPSSGSSIGFGNIALSWDCTVALESISIDLYKDGNLKSNLAVINNLNAGNNTFYWNRSTYNTIHHLYAGYSLRYTAFTANGLKLTCNSGNFSLLI